MPPPNPIRTIGTLVRATGPRTWIATLPNGKEVIAHVPERRVEAWPFGPGDAVALELTAYDFSMARIAGPAPTAES